MDDEPCDNKDPALYGEDYCFDFSNHAPPCIYWPIAEALQQLATVDEVVS